MNLNHAVLSADYIWSYQSRFPAYLRICAMGEYGKAGSDSPATLTITLRLITFESYQTGAEKKTSQEGSVRAPFLDAHSPSTPLLQDDGSFERWKDMDLCSLFRAQSELRLLNSLSNQRQIIVTRTSTLQTTLLMVSWTDIVIVSLILNSRAYVCAVYFIPALVGVL